MPVFQGHLLLKVLGEDDSRSAFDSFMKNANPDTILDQMDQGDMVGATCFVGSHEVPSDELEHRLQRIGSDVEFFQGNLDGDETDDGMQNDLQDRITDLPSHLEGRILRAQMRGDVSSVELQKVLLDFVRDAGLVEQFAAHLEGYVEQIIAPHNSEGLAP